jgi:CBS domain-containing protein
VVEGHSECGFVKCKGDVMATNPKWRRSLSEWIAAIKNWTKSYDPEDTRILTILLDYRPIWGNMSLADKFWKEIFNSFRESLTASHMMTKDDLQYRLPISFLGTFVTEKSGPHKNEIDLKKSGAAHIVNGVRIFAIKNQISEPSTFGRLKQLTEAEAISAEDAELFGASFETLMMFRIRENMKKTKQGKDPDNYIDPYSLRKRERMILKDALSGVSQLQKLVNKEFNAVWLRYFV